MNGRGRETGCTSLHYLCVVSKNGNAQSNQWGSNAVVAGTDVAEVASGRAVTEKRLVYNERVVCSLNVNSKWPGHLKNCRKVKLT